MNVIKLKIARFVIKNAKIRYVKMFKPLETMQLPIINT